MKYIIMCGGGLGHWERPRHLTFVNNERIVARTIRLLKKNGVTDIAISSNNPEFVMFSVPVITNMNKDCWVDAFVPEDGPVCYMMGDVVYSEKAIKKIVETETEDIEFFASSPPFSRYYIKPWAEPFAFKVVNQKHLKKDANIEELDLSIRAYNLLARANIQTIEELQGKTKSEIMRVRNMGLKSLREIEEKLIKVTGSGFADEREENE